MDNKITLESMLDYSDKCLLELEETNYAVYDNDMISEVSALVKNAVRGGKVVSVTTCPAGYHLQSDGKCAKTSPAQAMAMSKRALKAAKTRKRKGGNSVQIAKSRAKSMKVRGRLSPNTFKEKKL